MRKVVKVVKFVKLASCSFLPRMVCLSHLLLTSAKSKTEFHSEATLDFGKT